MNPPVSLKGARCHCAIDTPSRVHAASPIFGDLFLVQKCRRQNSGESMRDRSDFHKTARCLIVSLIGYERACLPNGHGYLRAAFLHPVHMSTKHREPENALRQALRAPLYKPQQPLVRAILLLPVHLWGVAPKLFLLDPRQAARSHLDLSMRFDGNVERRNPWWLTSDSHCSPRYARKLLVKYRDVALDYSGSGLPPAHFPG